ncbi:Zinc finger CCHC domain-containing protein 7 [Halotydeus destructor]|nr:Zinc finger CCHC domain-containing protein 7 [Halotydeus destructor]
MTSLLKAGDEEWVSDEVDSDIEVRLYSSIHHSFDKKQIATECKIVQIGSSSLKPSFVPLSNLGTVPEKTPIKKYIRKRKEVVTILSDTDSESKAHAVGKKQNGRHIVSETLISDESSKDHYFDDSSDSSGFENGAEEAIARASSLKDTRLGNVVNGDQVIHSIPLALSQEYCSQDSGAEDLPSVNIAKKPWTKKLKVVMSSFLDKCKSDFDPTTLDAVSPSKAHQRSTKEDGTPGTSKNKKGWKKKFKCIHCSKFTDHPSRSCKKKKQVCLLCAGTNHLERTCPDVICWKCRKVGHAGSNCSYDYLLANCDHCGLIGHKDDYCPNHWRKFHSVTSSGESVSKLRPKRNVNCSCSSCGRKGHFAFECRLVTQVRSGWPASPLLFITKNMPDHFKVAASQPVQKSRHDDDKDDQEDDEKGDKEDDEEDDKDDQEDDKENDEEDDEENDAEDNGPAENGKRKRKNSGSKTCVPKKLKGSSSLELVALEKRSPPVHHARNNDDEDDEEDNGKRKERNRKRRERYEKRNQKGKPDQKRKFYSSKCFGSKKLKSNPKRPKIKPGRAEAVSNGSHSTTSSLNVTKQRRSRTINPNIKGPNHARNVLRKEEKRKSKIKSGPAEAVSNGSHSTTTSLNVTKQLRSRTVNPNIKGPNHARNVLIKEEKRKSLAKKNNLKNNMVTSIVTILVISVSVTVNGAPQYGGSGGQSKVHHNTMVQSWEGQAAEPSRQSDMQPLLPMQPMQPMQPQSSWGNNQNQHVLKKVPRTLEAMYSQPQGTIVMIEDPVVLIMEKPGAKGAGGATPAAGGATTAAPAAGGGDPTTAAPAATTAAAAPGDI